MSITGTLSNALSGLTAQSRAAELVSSNVANAGTPGYARREIDLAPRYMGDGASSGVNVTGVRREVDLPVIQDRRLADASAGHASTVAKFAADFSSILGTPDQESSLTGRISRFEAVLVEAASRPDSEARLSAVLAAAKSTTDFLNSASSMVQEKRQKADTSIATQINALNDGLIRVQNLNRQIQEAIARGKDPSSLFDLRQQSIDEISSIVPMRQVERDHGTVALYTTGGAIVLDGRAARLGFTKVGVIVPDMTQSSGALSGVTINGSPIRTDGPRSPIAGGSLAGLFEVRDELAPKAQSRLDSVARDLVERFQDAGLDATRAGGDAGLFTDAGNSFTATDELGLSGRIRVNSAVDPTQGGASWRLRDGLGAAVPGDAGNSALLQDMRRALLDPRASGSSTITSAARSASGLASDLVSLAGSDQTDAELQQSFSVAEQDSLKTMELEKGVDTDFEMQKLMLIEQAYAANAKVITTVGDLIDTLIGL